MSMAGFRNMYSTHQRLQIDNDMLLSFESNEWVSWNNNKYCCVARSSMAMSMQLFRPKNNRLLFNISADFQPI